MTGNFGATLENVADKVSKNLGYRISEGAIKGVNPDLESFGFFPCQEINIPCSGSAPVAIDPEVENRSSKSIVPAGFKGGEADQFLPDFIKNAELIDSLKTEWENQTPLESGRMEIDPGECGCTS